MINSLTILLPIFGIFITASVSLFIWHLSQREKRRHEIYLRKLELYKELLVNLEGFYVNAPSTELKDKFINDSRVAWLYAPDEVLICIDRFYGTVHTGQISTNAQKENAVDDLVKAIRRDMNLDIPNLKFWTIKST